MATDKKKNKDDVKENNSRSSQHTGTSPGTQGVMGEANLRRKLQHRSDGEHLRWRSRYDPCSLLWFAQVGPLVRWTFTYLQLQFDDLMPTASEFNVQRLLQDFQRKWSQQQQRIAKKKHSSSRSPSLLFCVIAPHIPMLVFTGFLYALHQGASFAGPLLLRQIVRALECRQQCDGDSCGCEPKEQLYVYAAILCIAPTVTSLAQSHQLFLQQKIGVKLKNKLVAALYRKSLNLSHGSVQEQSTGRLLTLFSNDAEKIQQLMFFVHGIWGSPALIVVGLVVLYSFISWAAFVGFAAVFLLAPVGGFVTRKLFEYRKKLVSFTDKRTNILSEIVGGIRVIKYYAWNKPFNDRVQSVRDNELSYVWRIAYFQSVFSVLPYSAPMFVAVVSIGAYVLFIDTLTPSTAYTALSLINIIRLPLSFLPFIINNFLNALVASRRLKNFFEADECEQMEHDDTEPGRLVIESGLFSWTRKSRQNQNVANSHTSSDKQGEDRQASNASKNGKESKKAENYKSKQPSGDEHIQSEEFMLRDININIEPGSLVLIVGSTGSGKSALLNVFCNWMERKEGSVRVSGTCAFSSQTAWILNDTLQNNVLFGKELDNDFYEHSCVVSQLGQDIESLPHRDQTEIGERGVNLSGGQKQRVALARAVYADCDNIFLDDPFSAVDAHVGAAIFEHCVQDALSDKTRVVTTNALHLLPAADHVIVMDQGRITAQGSYGELVNMGVDFGEYVTASAERKSSEQSGNGNDSSDSKHVNQPAAFPSDKSLDESRSDSQRVERSQSRSTSRKKLYKDVSVGRSLSKKDERAALEEPMKQSREDEANHSKSIKSDNEKNLSGDEERSVGAVSPWVYKSYVRAAGGSLIVIMVLLAYSIDSAARAITEYWLTFMANDEFNQPIGWYVVGYVLLFGINVLLLYNRAIATFSSAVAASKRLHEGLLDRVLRLPMSFFDTTPSGRVLNRFSRDTELADTQLGGLLVQVLSAFFNILMSLVVISIATKGYMLIALPVLLGCYVTLQRVFVRTSRELQRIESTTRSPIYSNFRETVEGIPVIRAYGMAEHFVQKNDKFIDDNARAFINQKQANEWLSVRLDLLGTAIITLTGFLVIAVDSNAGIAGLALTYALDVTKFLKLGTTIATEVETKFNSIERIVEYLNLVTEDEQDDGSSLPMDPVPHSWPQSGTVTFQQVTMRYRPTTPIVLDQISFTVPAQAKVGICGRTGSGKSSLFMVLFRLVNIECGNVIIDDVNISKLDLSYRSRIGMIPQDPFLFGGTLRENMDPFNEYNDHEIWQALERANLKVLAAKTDKGLNMEITDNGGNLSQGQRQEATSSIDVQSDEWIQKTLRNHFSKATVLTIAHRINTIADADYVLVMSNGRVQEYDQPAQLLNDTSSEFYAMCSETGGGNLEHLKRVAQSAGNDGSSS